MSNAHRTHYQSEPPAWHVEQARYAATLPPLRPMGAWLTVVLMLLCALSLVLTLVDALQGGDDTATLTEARRTAYRAGFTAARVGCARPFVLSFPLELTP